MKARLRISLFLAALSAACDRFPAERLTDPQPEGAVNTSTSQSWLLYGDELRTGGGVYLLPEAANQALDLNWTDSPAVGRKAISYSWNGQAVPEAGRSQHLFAGFGLLAAQDIDELELVPGRDLSPAGFTKLKFLAKGTLSENVILRAEGPSDATNASASARLEISRAQLTGNWTEFTLSGIPLNDFRNVRQFVSFSLVFAQPSGTTEPGQGGTIFIDQISYEK